MAFSRQEYWSGLPFPSPGDLPNPGIKLTSPALQVDSLPLSHQGSPGTNYSAPNLSINPASPSSYSRPFKMDLESSHVSHCYYSCYPQTPTAFSPTPRTCPLFPSQQPEGAWRQPDGAWRQPFSPGPLQPNGFPDLLPLQCPTPLYHTGCLTPTFSQPMATAQPSHAHPTTEL